jgi:hypothetical protein
MLMLVVFPILPGKIKRVKTNKLFFDFFALWQRCCQLGLEAGFCLGFCVSFIFIILPANPNIRVSMTEY